MCVVRVLICISDVGEVYEKYIRDVCVMYIRCV